MPSDYLIYLRSYGTPEQLQRQTGKFLFESKKFYDFMLMNHRVHPDPFVCIVNHYSKFKLRSLQDFFKNFSEEVRPYHPVKFAENYICFGEGDLSRNDVIFIISKNKVPESVIDVMRSYDLLYRQCLKARELEKGQIQTEYENIISQLMHDVASLLTLTKNYQNSDELTDRIRFQEKTNHRLLSYIRDPELYLTEIGVNELFMDSLALMEISSKKINIKINAGEEKILVDVELFSKALIEILKNSIKAVQNNLSDISITVNKIPPATPFNNTFWLHCEIRDAGKGIHQDFKEFVGTPFFTTLKNEGHAGLGLSVAKKMIAAHNGILEVNSKHGSGTVVTIYLPLC